MALTRHSHVTSSTISTIPTRKRFKCVACQQLWSRTIN